MSDADDLIEAAQMQLDEHKKWLAGQICMMKRSEYMDNYDGGEVGAKLHRAYYGQFVTDKVRDVVLRCIGADAIKASTDQHRPAQTSTDQHRPALQRHPIGEVGPHGHVPHDAD